MIKEITKPTSKQTVAAIKSGDFSEVDKIEEMAEKDARQVFNAVASGAVPLIWYDLPPVRCRSCGTPCIGQPSWRITCSCPVWRLRTGVSFRHQTVSIAPWTIPAFSSSSGIFREKSALIT